MYWTAEACWPDCGKVVHTVPTAPAAWDPVSRAGAREALCGPRVSSRCGSGGTSCRLACPLLLVSHAWSLGMLSPNTSEALRLPGSRATCTGMHL